MQINIAKPEGLGLYCPGRRLIFAFPFFLFFRVIFFLKNGQSVRGGFLSCRWLAACFAEACAI